MQTLNCTLTEQRQWGFNNSGYIREKDDEEEIRKSAGNKHNTMGNLITTICEMEMPKLWCSCLLGMEDPGG